MVQLKELRSRIINKYYFCGGSGVILPIQKMQFQSLGWEDPLEKEMAAHSSILAWEVSWTEEPGRLLGLQRVRQLSN